MLDGGLQTQTEPIPESSADVEAILAELRQVDAGDVRSKLDIAGFLNRPHPENEMSCMHCMYYLFNREWCDLPELALPVEAEWWCRLWRI